MEELLQEIQCEKVPSLTVAPPYEPGERASYVVRALELETRVQMPALSLSPSLQRLKQRQRPSSLNPWSPCVGICRHSSGAKRQRTVACACRLRYLLALQGGKEGPGHGCPRVVSHTQEGFAPTVYGELAASVLLLRRDTGTVARTVDPGGPGCPSLQRPGSVP